jgi:Zn-dependent membrane protease YugP
MYYGYGLGYGYYFDPTYILIIIAAVIALIAQAGVSITFARYQKVRSARGLSGAMVAEEILRSQGIFDVGVCHVSGNLTDHYDPRTKMVNLSDSVYNATSVAAIAVAAHECGHAIQHNKGYVPLALRSGLVPFANIGSKASWIFIILGVLMGFNQTLITVGILMFSLAVLFQIVTLPVEFNASNRALNIIKNNGMLIEKENSYARAVLTAAAFTYVASAASAVLQLLRLIILFGGRDDRD